LAKAPYSKEGECKMLDRVKWFTQRTTGLLLFAIGVFVIPFVLAKVVQITGLLSLIDGMFSSGHLLLWFWVCFVVSRAVYAGGWCWLFERTWVLGQRNDFWWFKKEHSYSTESEHRDQSAYILGIIAAIGIILFLAEFAIRIYTETFPPYLPPAH
jgi:hypothetical protein